MTTRKAAESLLVMLRNFKRQALHAAMLRLAHPITSEILELMHRYLMIWLN
ncbi:hypothetical protein [Arsukibacterium sp.]|uniref:hypothetical protein n=1 Tax=Arsukibacterium sp. TaxID=1977258 RepID=UPI00261463A1|nr:hypothetical protein [Arsukibacterium sp.]